MEDLVGQAPKVKGLVQTTAPNQVFVLYGLYLDCEEFDFMKRERRKTTWNPIFFLDGSNLDMQLEWGHACPRDRISAGLLHRCSATNNHRRQQDGDMGTIIAAWQFGSICDVGLQQPWVDTARRLIATCFRSSTFSLHRTTKQSGSKQMTHVALFCQFTA